jgi:hypothetical protein
LNLTIENFRKYSRTYKDGTTVIFPQSKCKDCNFLAVNKENRNTWRSTWRKENKHNIKLYFQDHLSAYKRRFPENFNITAPYLFEIYDAQEGKCHYCKTNMVFKIGKVIPETLSLDRLTPLDGYSISNVVWACFKCNTMKGSSTVNEFVDKMNLILLNLKILPKMDSKL